MSKTSTTAATKTPKAASTKSQTAPSVAACTDGLQDKIAMRAYEKWLKNGCQHGCDQQHWLEAEEEIKAEMSKRVRA